MAQRSYQPLLGSVQRGVVPLFSRVVLGSSGAVSSQDGAKLAGFTVTKTASKTGRYTITLDKNYARLLWADVRIIAADDTAYTTAKGADVLIRDDDVGRGAGDGTFELQFCRSDTEADAEVEDSRDLLFMVVVRDANVT